MEIPEKIYLQDSMSTDTVGELWPEWFDAKVSDNSIEYIRTDTFIEKAVIFLKNWDTYRVCLEGHKDWFIEQFENYMKGE